MNGWMTSARPCSKHYRLEWRGWWPAPTSCQRTLESLASAELKMIVRAKDRLTEEELPIMAGVQHCIAWHTQAARFNQEHLAESGAAGGIDQKWSQCYTSVAQYPGGHSQREGHDQESKPATVGEAVFDSARWKVAQLALLPHKPIVQQNVWRCLLETLAISHHAPSARRRVQNVAGMGQWDCTTPHRHRMTFSSDVQ